MSLSDYNDPVEKIAALRAAWLDPALTQFKTDVSDEPYTVTEDIYVYYASYLEQKLIAQDGTIYNEEYATAPLNLKFNSGDVLSAFLSVHYVADADIVYSDPIGVYQKRLAAIDVADTINVGYIAVPTQTFTAGANGSILKSSHSIRFADGSYFASRGGGHPLPVPAGITISVDGSGKSLAKYFDVPADW